MNNFKKMMAAVLVLCMAFALCACAGTPAQTEPSQPAANAGEGEAAYRVNVMDAQGQPYADGVVVRFMQGDTQAAMQVVGENGVAEKTLAKGEYTVELVFTDAEAAYHYDQTDLTLTADKTELSITLAKAVGGEPRNLFANGKDYQAYSVESGSTYVELVPGDRTYFLFAPTQAGTYKVTTSDAAAAVGYYGAPHFVQSESVAEVVDNAFTISISAGMVGTGDTGTAVLVIGVDSAELESCMLSIERIGEAEHTISDEPWTEYATTHTPEAFSLKLEAGQKLTYVNIEGNTEDYQVVLGEDGFYHMGTADGPVVYVNLGKDAPHISFQVIIQGDGPMGGAPIRKYFYDENGEFVKKEDYTDILVSYFECMDKTYNLYPLTEDLKYIIQNGGEGWWDISSPDYILEGCNPEIAWLFACCFIAQ